MAGTSLTQPAPIDVLRMFWTEARRRLGKLILCFLAASVVLALPLPDLDYGGRAAAAIFVLAALLWATEAIPLFATSLLVIALEVLLLALPGLVPGLEGDAGVKTFFAAASNPIIALFFGGLLLATAATRYQLDIAMARWFLKPFGKRPAMVLAGVMTITGLFSMWMSNTATTAMMLAILGPMLAKLDRGDPFRRALVLSVPFAANIGGIGTPIGTPPNAVALGALREMGVNISFGQWMIAACPLMLLMMVFAWLLLVKFFPPQAKELDLSTPEGFRLPMTAYVVMAVFGLTVLLWLTESVHHIPESVVALFPAVVFTALCILDARDVNSLEWNVLILIAGGISLGIAMQQTGLDKWVVDQLPLGGMAPVVIVGGFTLLAMVLSSFMSHTAATNLIIPVALSVTLVAPVWMGVMVAVGSSLAMALPISTPPNALAYATGELNTKDMLKVGAVISIVGTLLLIVTGKFAIQLFLGHLMP